MSRSGITTHVLDIALGQPARGIHVALDVSVAPDRWSELGRGMTDGNGRLGRFDPPIVALEAGVYRLRFATGPYFSARGVDTLYPEVAVVIRIDDPAQDYHIPLLLSPFGYSTYRGS